MPMNFVLGYPEPFTLRKRKESPGRNWQPGALTGETVGRRALHNWVNS